MSKRFPQYLSAPFQVLWFETDELGLLVIFFLLAMLFGSFFWILIFVGPHLYSGVKAKYPRGFLKHSLYFLGILKMKGYPLFFEHRFFV